MSRSVLRRQFLACFACFLILPAIDGFGQTTQNPSATSAPTAVIEMPHDPVKLMALGAQSNRLIGDAMKPWHLKVAYTITDEKGAVNEQGTIEQFWAGTHKIRTIYTVGEDSQTTFITDTGMFITGDRNLENLLAIDALREFVQPLPEPSYLQQFPLEIQPQKVGDIKLSCVQLKPDPNFHQVGPPQWMSCFEQDKPILRINVAGGGSKQAVRNATALFQGRYIPKNIRLQKRDKTALTAQLEILESLQSVKDSEFVPPQDAKPLPPFIAIAPNIVTGLLFRGVPPHYPENAKAFKISGTVEIHVRIDTDGHIHDPQVVSGPSELRQAALDAVKDWIYQPYLFNGQVVEIDTVIKIIFNIGS